MPRFTTLSAAALVAGLALTGCGSDGSSDSSEKSGGETTESAPAPLDAASAKDLAEKLLGAVNCTESEFAEAEEIEKTNKDEDVTLLGSAFCGIEKPTKTAYFVSISEEDDDFDKIADYFEEQMEQDDVDLETKDVRGDGWQVLVMAEKELPADIDEQEAALKEAAGR